MTRIDLSLVILSALLVLLLAGCGGSSSTSGAFGRITGVAHELPLGARSRTRAPGDAVTVRVEGTSLSAETAADGSFVIDRVPPGLHTLVASSGQRAGALVVMVEAGQETNVGEMVLRDAGQISGLVTSAATGDPIPGALVTVIEMIYTNPAEQMPAPVRTAITDSYGSYTVSGLPAGDYLVTINALGYQPASLLLTVSPGSTTPGDAALTPVPPAEMGSVAGAAYLVTDDGMRQPVAGALVYLAPPTVIEPPLPLPPTAIGEDGQTVPLYGGQPEMPEPWYRYYTFTGEDGTYRIDGVVPGDYLAAAVRPGLEPDQHPVTVIANAVATVDFELRLRPPLVGTVQGTVTDATTQQPIAGAVVTAVLAPEPVPLSAGPGPADGQTGGGSGFVVPGEVRMVAITDDQGHYQLEVPSAVTAIAVYASGYVPQEAPVAVVPGETVTVDVALQPASTTPVTLRGRVDAQGDGALTPAPGATVHALSASITPGDPILPAEFTAVTDAQGEHSLLLPPDGYVIFATKDELRSEMVRLPLYEDTTLDLVLGRWFSPPDTGSRKRAGR